MSQILRLSVLLHLSLVFVALSACTEQTPPVFGDPVPLVVPADTPAIGPRLTQSNNEGAILSWMERDEKGATLNYSSFALDEWSSPNSVTSDEKMFINWADLPSVTSTGPKALFAHWLSYTAGETYSYQVLTAQSADNGASWSTPVAPHDDGTDTEHGFVSSFAAKGGTGLIWLDGRRTPKNGMTLRSATVAADGSISDEQLLDELVCDCCQTSVAMSKDGAVAVYRNRTEEEIRDIYVTRHLDGQWQPGTAIADDGWVISGCPVNGPSIAADGDLVVVAWFTAANARPLVSAAISRNSGRTFSAPVELASGPTLGHVAAAVIDRHSVAISWLDKDKKGTYSIRLQGVTSDGQLSRIETVGRTNLARNVPQMVRVNDELIFAWADTIADTNKVASVKVKIIGFYD